MGQLYNGVIDYDRLKYLITDAASYMLSAGVTLKALYPHLLHITCAAHGIKKSQICHYPRNQLLPVGIRG